MEFDACRPVAFGPWRKVPVPSAFDDQLGRAGQRGAAVYRRPVDMPPGRPARLWFGAASIRARVFVDEVLLAESACGYAPFTMEVPPATHTRQWVTVCVDNRFDTDAAPLHEPFFDFYQYGGILREVPLDVLPADGPWIGRVEVTPVRGIAGGKWTCGLSSATRSCRRRPTACR